MSNQVENMSCWRKKIFPIANSELKKFVPMAIIMLVMLFNYTIMRDAKDALVITHPVSDAEVISFLKLLITTPASLVFAIIFTKMVNVFSSEKIFYIVVSFFLIFFALFAFVLYPFSASIHPSIETIKTLQLSYPFFARIFAIWGMWSYAAFYVMAELWGTSMVSLMFYKFANEIIKTDEAKRFYPMFILFGNFALIISGPLITYCSKMNPQLDSFIRWGIALKLLTTIMLIAGAIGIALYRWMHVYVLTDKKYYDPSEKKIKKSKPKMGVLESFSYILSSPYLLYLAVLVLAYGASIHIVEVAWKKSLGIYAVNPNDYVGIMGWYSFATGVSTIVLTMFVKGVISRFGWLTGAIITPLILGGTGILFLLLFLLNDQLSPLLASLGCSALGAAVLVGALQGILSKSTKYSLFDPTKEMAYIPLDDEIKAKGKAAVDVVGGRLGKSSGSIILIAIYSITGINDIKQLTNVVLVILVFLIICWVWAVFGLAKRYNNLIAAREAEKLQAVINQPIIDAPKDGETNFASENKTDENK